MGLLGHSGGGAGALACIAPWTARAAVHILLCQHMLTSVSTATVSIQQIGAEHARLPKMAKISARELIYCVTQPGAGGSVSNA